MTGKGGKKAQKRTPAKRGPGAPKKSEEDKLGKEFRVNGYPYHIQALGRIQRMFGIPQSDAVRVAIEIADGLVSRADAERVMSSIGVSVDDVQNASKGTKARKLGIALAKAAAAGALKKRR